MARQKKARSQSKEPKGYRKKVLLGLVPHIYDKNSKSFQAGAWKNLPPEELNRNRRAVGRGADA